MARIPMSHRIFTPYDSREVVYPGELALSMSDTVFGFLHEEYEGSPESILYDEYNQNDQEEEQVENSSSNVEDNKKFWDNQYQLVQVLTIFNIGDLEHKHIFFDSQVKNHFKPV